MSERLSIVILAAGAASRFGSAKQLAVIDGETMLDRAVRNAQATGCDDVVVVTANDAPPVAIPSSIVRVVRNSESRSGMASSIRIGVAAALASDAVLILLCDQIAVTAADLSNLITIWRRNRDSMIAAQYGEIVGVPAIFPRRDFASLLTLQGDQGARAILRTSDRVIHVPLPNAALDVDSPADLASLPDDAVRPQYL